MEAQTRSDYLASRVCQARDEAGLTNAELARKAGIPRRTVVRITNGQNKQRINPETIEAIAEATGKPASFFLYRASSRVADAIDGLYAALLHDLREEIAADAALTRDRETFAE